MGIEIKLNDLHLIMNYRQHSPSASYSNAPLLEPPLDQSELPEPVLMWSIGANHSQRGKPLLDDNLGNTYVSL